MGYYYCLVGIYAFNRSIPSFKSIHPTGPFTTAKIVDVTSTSRFWVSYFDSFPRKWTRNEELVIVKVAA